MLKRNLWRHRQGYFHTGDELNVEFREETNCDIRIRANHFIMFSRRSQYRNGHLLDTHIFSIGALGGIIRPDEKW